MANKIRILVFGLVLSVGLLAFNGCAYTSGYSLRSLDVKPTGLNAGLLNLQNLDDKDFSLSQSLMGNGFLTASTEEYGYYFIHYRQESDENDGLQYLAAYTLGILPVLGVPTDSRDFRLTVYLDLFDSNGDKIASFEKKESFTHYTGLYYGGDSGKSAEKAASRIFKAIQGEIQEKSDEINQRLREAGPITADKDAVVRKKLDIAELEKRYESFTSVDYDTRRTSYNSSGKVLSESGGYSYAPSAGGSSATSAFKDGKYVMSGANPGDANMVFVDFSKTVDLNMGYSQEAKGSYTVSGNTLTIKWSTVYNEHARENMQGKTFVYTISGDGTSFSGNGVTYIKQ